MSIVFSIFDLLVKEQESLLQKMKDMEDAIEKLKEEVEFLQLEVESKDKEISEYIIIIFMKLLYLLLQLQLNAIFSMENGPWSKGHREYF